ncbi:DUF86 domain-containing protein [Fusibacter sp. 3D3]|uniref:type VII toxin-antitoxin system HepT family RNase toxin n=1 Tax=Fusibacter sp. 3D3 TaxID=1048380 RepID=UPI0008532965|nr:DUF86 domain-containing protein [Fusibacter sp. 3D3]GAU79623.1 hypothetical protein F3D3_4287 [Fusibacter sp. 3D3]
MVNDVVLNKKSVVERCLKRIREEYDNTPSNLDDFTKQDSIILNIQRAIEACIDLAMHIVSQKRLGIPQSSRDAFDLLYQNGIIKEMSALKMKSMIGFRNLAVHDYQKLNLDVLKRILESHLGDFDAFIDEIK